MGIHPVDMAVIGVYLLLLVVIGIGAARSVKTTSDFFIGGRRFGKFVSVMLSFGAGTHSDQAVGVISKCYQVGLAGIWYQWLWLLVTPFYWIMGPLVRRIREVTTADVFRKRYNENIASLYAVIALIIISLDIGMMLLGSGRIIEAVSGGEVSFAMAIWGMTILFVSYGIAGGLVAAAATDVIQGVLTIVLSFIMLPFAIIRAGGFAGLHEKLSHTTHDMFSLIAPGEITLFFLVMVVINAVVNWPCQPHHVPIAASSKRDLECRIGITYGNMVKRFCTVAWAFTGVAAIVLVPNLENPDHAFGELVKMLLPTGLIGLMLASVFAAVQSTCDALMVSGAGIFTRNIYKPFIAAGRHDSHYLVVARLSSLVIVGFGLLFAFFLPGIIKGLELLWQIPSLMGIAFWAGVFWRRANPASAWASFITATVTFFLCEQGLFMGLSIPLPWQMLAYLSTGIAAAIIVGFLTQRQPKEQLDKFYSDLKTPVGYGEQLSGDVM